MAKIAIVIYSDISSREEIRRRSYGGKPELSLIDRYGIPTSSCLLSFQVLEIAVFRLI